MNGKVSKLLRKVANLSEAAKRDEFYKVLKWAYKEANNKEKFVKQLKENYLLLDK